MCLMWFKNYKLMKHIKLILKIVAFVFMLWAIKHVVSTDDRTTGDKESSENIVGIDKDVDAQAMSILSDDVIESSIDADDDFTFNSGIVLSGQEYLSVSAVYEKYDNNVEISLPVKGMVVTIELITLSVGEYSLSDDSGNTITLFDGEKFISYNDGVVVISAVSDGGISGSFTSGKLLGKFSNALPASRVEIKGKDITHARILYFSMAAETAVVKKLLPSAFYYDSSLVTLTVKGDSDKNFSGKIDRIETTPTAVTLYVAGNEINFITVDKLNSNQVTIQYKNGDSLVLL